MKFTAKVISGEGRGKELGFPTINMVVPDPFKLKAGVYACWVRLESSSQMYVGALHYGPIPVFDQEKYSLEVHLLDIEENITPKKLTIDIVKHLRPVMYFPDPPELISQIEEDVRQIRKALVSDLS